MEFSIKLLWLAKKEDMIMKDEQKIKYMPWMLEIVMFPEEDVIRTSYADDNNGDWDDEDANPIGTF